MNLDELAKKYGGSPVQSGSSKFDELAQKYGGVAAEVEAAPQRKSTVGSELVRGGKQLVSSIRTGAGALTGSPEEAALAGVARSQAIGEEAGEGASLEAVKRAYQERGLLSAAGEVAGQIPRALAGQVPQLAAMAGTAKLGAMAGAPLGPAGVIGGGILGAGASLLPQFFGSNIERQAAEQMARDEQVKIDRGAAGAAAAGQAAIEGAGTAFVLGKRIVKGVLGMADDAALTTAKAQQAMTQAAQRSLAASAGRGIAKGAVVEMPVEIAQSVLERAQAGLDVTSPEALSEYGEVAYQAGLVGGAIGAGAGPIDTAMARQGVKARTAFEEAEAKRVADAEAARLAAEAEAKAKAPPLALGAENVFTPVVLPDGSVAMTREELAQYEAEQFRKKYEPQEVEQPPVPEPYVKPPSISGTKPESLMAEPRDALADAISARRAAAEPQGEVPLVDNYAFLQREKQRLLQQDQTPDTKKLIGRIDERLNDILKSDIERQRADALALKKREEADAEAAKTSVFGQADLPPVESREEVVGKEELANLQAKEVPVEMSDFELSRAKNIPRKQPRPVTEEDEIAAEQEKELKKLLAERNKIKTGGNLYRALEGQLDASEVTDIAPDIKKLYGKGFKPLVRPGGSGTFISELVDDGLLDNFLPDAMRKGSETYDVQESAEYIKNKLRTKDTKAEVSTEKTRELDEKISYLSNVIDDRERLQKNLASIEPGEAASVERTAGDQAVGETVDDIRYQRGTAGGKSIGKEQTQAIVDAIKARWDNAPDTVVAENMDDPAIPQEVRDHNKAAIAAGAKGSPKGFFYKGKAYILADTMKSPSDVIETLFHESLGHYGLRGTFGPEMGKVLADVVKNRRADVEEKARQYGLDVNSESDMLEAAEEVLATIAQTKPGLSFVKRAIAVIRNFLRDLGLPFKMSNEDIIQKYILPARAFVEKGERRKVAGTPAAMREAPSSIPTGLTGIGYKLIPRGDARRFKNFGTWEKDGVRVALSSDLLMQERGTVQKYDSDGDAMTIEAVITDADARGQGRAKKAMQDIIRFADEIGKDLYLEPVQLEKESGLSRDQLVQFYSSLGFKPTDASGLVMERKAKPAAMREPAKAPPTESAAFKKWFGDSKVVDESGKPLVVYHGTKAFDEYGETEGDAFTQFAGLPNWFAEEPYTASGYAGAEGTIYPAYLSIKSPLSITNFDMNDDAEAAYALARRLGVDVRSLYLPEDAKAYNVVSSPQFVEAAQKAGYDGIKVKEGDYNTYAVFDPTQIKSATGNIGTYDPESADIRYQRDSITGKPILAQWTTPTDTKIAGDIGKDDIIYSLQNKMIDTKRVVDAISATVGKIAAKWNPYLQEELYHGRTAKQTKDFLADELRPLMQAMEKAGVTIADMETYLKNRHAIAYNAQVAKVNPNMPDKGSGIATADAQAYLDNLSPADKAKYEALAKRVDAITKGTRDLLVDSGLETKETIKNWEETFPFYVPLKRGDIDYAYTAAGMGTGQGFDVRGSFSQRAMGSEREATDVLANIAMMRERAIVKSQKNRVAQALFGLAAQNPNPQFWLPVDPLAEVSPENMQELINFGLSQEDLDFIAKEPRQKVVDKNRNEVVERINATLRRNENVLSMRFNGQDRYVFFNPNDPRAKRMAMSMKNLDADQLGNILGPISTITRWMAAVNTQYNPIFGAYNFLRDVQGAALQLSDTPLANDRKAVVSGTLPALRGIYAAVRAERSGEKAEGPWADLWNDFQEQGGQTGFRDQFSRSQERAEALQKELNKISEGKAKAAGRAIFDWLSDYNDSMENAVRLSAYKAALDKGIGKEEAASIAKNLTVNFNRKGQIGVQAGALYAFFNAAVQGTTRLAQTLKGPAGKKIIAGGLLLGTMQAALLASAGFDEEEPPEFVRERNLILPIGGDKYLAFPMPLGYHVIPGTSRILTEWALSGFKNTAERIASLTGMYLEAFNPIGNAGWSAQTLAPTFADPIVALTENKDWTGKPIAREDFSNLDPTPGYTRSKEATSVVFKEIAKFLNFASGGTDFKPGVFSPTPDQLEYLLGQATGGIGRELSKAATTVEKTITGEELPSYKIPLVGRFYGETKSSAAESNRFYKNMEKLNKHENEIKGRRENKQPVTEYLQDNPEARLAPLARKVYNDVRELRKRREALIERDAPKASVQAVEKMITRKMQTLNDRVRALEESEN